jgi:hypothetical protein
MYNVYVKLPMFNGFYLYFKGSAENSEHRKVSTTHISIIRRNTMETYENDPSLPGVSIHKSCSINTEAGGDSNIAAVSYHDLHCIKAESGSDKKYGW